MQQLIEFLKRNNYVFLFLLLMAASIVMMVQSSFYHNSIIVSWGSGISGWWYTKVSGVDEYFNLKSENEKLVAENAMLRARMEESYVSYTKTVFEIDDTVYKQRYSYTDAQVIKSSWSQPNNYIMINKGTKQGIRPDMAVISPQGVVGIVVNCSPSFATIMPIIHSDSRNSVRVRRVGTSGTLQWDGRDYRYATVVDIPTTHELVEGDTVITSGLANDFPEGIVAGYVTQVSSDEGNGFYTLKIRLATDFNKLGHVYVIDNHFKLEQEALMKETEEMINE